MSRLPVLIVVVLTGGCHRLTGTPGGDGVYRHFNGWLLASEISMWLGSAAVAVGMGFLAYYGINGDFSRAKFGWAAALLVIGLTVATGAYATWLQLRAAPS